jgi:hypothetical protein
MRIEHSDHVRTSHQGHVAWLVLAALLGAIVGYAIGADLQKSNNIEDNASVASTTSTVASTSAATSPATAKPTTTKNPIGFITEESSGTESVFYKYDMNMLKTKLFSFSHQPDHTIYQNADLNPMKNELVYVDGSYNLVLRDLDINQESILKKSNTSAASTMTNVGDLISYMDAHYSPDGKKILANWGGWEWTGFATMNADGTNYTKIKSEVNCGSFQLSWAPNSETFAVGGQENDMGGEPECLYVADFNAPTKGQYLYQNTSKTVNRNDIFNPTWSPDGTQIAFGYKYLGDNNKLDNTSTENTKYRGIYIIDNKSGASMKQVSNNQSFSTNPLWLDNSTLIYGLSNFKSGKTKGIESIKTDGTANTTLYSGKDNYYEPLSLSSDAKYLLYRSGDTSDTYFSKGASITYNLLNLTTKTSQEVSNYSYDQSYIDFVGWVY